MRYVAIDFGERRTGIALGDSETRVVSPLTVIDVGAEIADGQALLEAIARTVEDQLGPARRAGSAGARLHSPGELVVGLPMNMDGSEGPAARRVRALSERLAQRVGRTVHFQDERLTSAQADWDMARSGLTHRQKRDRRDALAAAAILEDFLSGSSEGSGEPHEA